MRHVRHESHGDFDDDNRPWPKITKRGVVLDGDRVVRFESDDGEEIDAEKAQARYDEWRRNASKQPFAFTRSGQR